MAKARRRKVPVTSEKGSLASSCNPSSSRTLIRKFHVLLKRQAQLQLQPQPGQCVKTRSDVAQQIEDLGGMSAYQRMSSIGQGNDRGGGSEKVLIQWLKELGLPHRNGKGKLTLLEVGALKPNNYQACSSWMEVSPIDLRSRHPAIVEQDFLLMDPTKHNGIWDVISLSLVVNFVPDPRDRGRMLSMAHDMLRPEGLLFLALPLPCVANSRYLNFDHMAKLMDTIGFKEIRVRWKEGGKMVYWLFLRQPQGHAEDNVHRKLVLREGNRNNFCILLPTIT